MATREATRYAGRYVKRVQHEPGAVLISARDLRKAIANAYDAGTGLPPAPKRGVILNAFWDAVVDGTKFIELSDGIDVGFLIDGTRFVVNTAAAPGLLAGKKRPYRSFLEDSVVAQVRATQVPVRAAAVTGDQS